MSIKVLIVDSAHPVLCENLEKAGFNCDYFPEITTAEIYKMIPAYHVIVVRSKLKIDRDIINKALNLRIIARIGSGLENIDVDYSKSKGIVCINSPEGNRDAVGEHAIGILLSLLKKIPQASQEIKSGLWNRFSNTGTEIAGKTVGIIGYGNTGSAFAERLAGFGAIVLAYDKYKTSFGNTFVKEVQMQQIFEYSEIVSLHIPLNQETHYLVNDLFINSFKNNFILINTSRGPIVKTSDLLKNIVSGKVSGAGLDVLEYEDTSFEQLNINNEPSIFAELIAKDNVILTPHVAGITRESFFRLSDVISKKIIDILRNKN